MADSWRKQWRKVWQNPLFKGRANYFVVWMWILDHACWDEYKVMFGGEIITLKPGQLTCGSVQIEEDTGVPSSSVRRIIVHLQSERLIERQVSSTSSLITVKKWDMYNGSEQEDEQQPSSSRAAGEQQVSTKEEGKRKQEDKEGKRTTVSDDTDVVPQSEVEFRKFIDWLNERGILKSKKQWTDSAQKKWNRRRKEFEAIELAQAFANLQNDPRGWWVETNGWRTMEWWLHSEKRINDLQHCHIQASSKQSTSHVSL